LIDTRTPQTWLQLVRASRYHPRCDDGSLLPNSALVQWANYLLDATERAYRSFARNKRTRQILEALGFVDISEQVIKVLLNPWPSDPHLGEMGRWYNLGLVRDVEALSFTLFIHVPLGKGGCRQNRRGREKAICMKKYHAYCNM